MIININYNKSTNNKSILNYALFLSDNYNTQELKNFFSLSEINLIKEMIKNSNLTKNIISFNLNSSKRIFLINVKKNINNNEIEILGAEFYEYIKDFSLKNLIINTLTTKKENENFISHFLHGLKLRSYEFNIYKSNKDKKIININVLIKSLEKIKKNHLKFKAIEIGTNFAERFSI